MARWYCDDPEYSQISKEDKELRDKIVGVMAQYLTEMEGYSYFGSNPGIPEDDLEDAADDILQAFFVESRV